MVTAGLRISSFIIKVWVGQQSEEDRSTCYFQVTHVESGQQQYLQTLREATDFMIPLLVEMGVKPTWWWYIRQWWKKRRK